MRRLGVQVSGVTDLNLYGWQTFAYLIKQFLRLRVISVQKCPVSDPTYESVDEILWPGDPWSGIFFSRAFTWRHLWLNFLEYESWHFPDVRLPDLRQVKALPDFRKRHCVFRPYLTSDAHLSFCNTELNALPKVSFTELVVISYSSMANFNKSADFVVTRCTD